LIPFLSLVIPESAAALIRNPVGAQRRQAERPPAAFRGTPQRGCVAKL